MAVSGGLLGVIGAIYQEFLQNSFLLSFVAAPIIEESMKPAGVYILLARWPHLLTSRVYTACLSALGGLSFAVIENLIYINLYFPEHTEDSVLFRFTVCLAVHVVASFIYGFGINQRLKASINGEIPFLQGSKRYFFTAMIFHSLYNIGITIYEITCTG